MKGLVLKLRLFVGAEKALLELKAGRTTQKAVLFIGAAVFLILALCMLHLAGYTALTDVWEATTSALVIAGIDALVATVVILWVRRKNVETEHEKTLRSLRDLAFKELETDVEGYQAMLVRIGEELERIHDGLKIVHTLSAIVDPVLSALFGVATGRNTEKGSGVKSASTREGEGV